MRLEQWLAVGQLPGVLASPGGSTYLLHLAELLLHGVEQENASKSGPAGAIRLSATRSRKEPGGGWRVKGEGGKVY